MLSFTPPTAPIRRTLIASVLHDVEAARQVKALACHIEVLLEAINSDMLNDERAVIGLIANNSSERIA